MPYKEGDKWRATPVYRGRRLKTKQFARKKDALDYERDKKREARKEEENSQKGLDLLSFCSKYLAYAERFSVKTLKEKQALCKAILKRWGPDRLTETITIAEMQEYIDDQASLRSPNAANKDRKNLMALWTYGKEKLELSDNPVRHTEGWTHKRALPQVYRESEVLALIMAATREEKLILKVFLETAGRRGEVWGLTIHDLNIEQQSLCLWTQKTGGDPEGEWLPITEALALELKWWLKNRPKKIRRSVYLFPNPRTGKPYVDPRKWLGRICDRAKIENKGFHAFRRFVGSIMVDKHKVSMKFMQALYRHKRLTTTERYLHQVYSALRDMAGLAVPEEKTHNRTTQPQKRG